MAAIIAKLVLFFQLFFQLRCAEVNDRWYPKYHLAPPSGWMNDPNGFCVFKNEYHLFYQYNPESSLQPGIAHWGHAKSPDLFQWEHLPISMYPDQWYDKTGVFSGSALVEDDIMYLFYTGNLNHPDQTPDHEQHQALATSSDGVTVTKYEENPVINAPEHQPNIRDPKVWKHGDTYYMVLGNSFNSDTLGRALLYTSSDMKSWTEASVLDQSNGTLGFMWECPDFFELDGKFVLLFSPQGVKPQGDKYKNLYQTGYIVGDFDYQTNKFTPTGEFYELDHGHDFYATQTILDESGRRIVIAWFDMWEQDYPERADGFTGHMTIPRVLSLTEEGRLIQTPVKEIENIRQKTVFSGSMRSGRKVELKDNAGEIVIETSKRRDLEIVIQSSNSKDVVKISYKYGRVSLNRGGKDAVRRTTWTPKENLKWRIFIDSSSIELFCGDGEVTFSSRFFPDGAVTVGLGQNSRVDMMKVYSIQQTVPSP